MLVAFLYFVFLVAATIAGALHAWLRLRRVRARTVLKTVASIVAQNLPLTRALRAAAQPERGAVRRMYQRLAVHLECGDDLSAALRAAVRACPGHVLGAVQAGERSGTLPAALTSAVREPPPIQPRVGRLPLWYPAVLLSLAPLMMLYLRTFIAPNFKEIFADFGIPLPAVTGALFGDDGTLLLALLLALMLFTLAVVQSLILRNFVPRLADRVQVIYWLWDTLVWYCPLSRPVARVRALARQLPVLEAAVRAGHDLFTAARETARIPVNWYARQRLTVWATALQSGADPLEAARAAGLPAALQRALAAARQGGELPAQLAYLSAYYQSLAVHWEDVLLSALAPLVVVAWGLVVGYVTVALIWPLAALQSSTAALVY